MLWFSRIVFVCQFGLHLGQKLQLIINRIILNLLLLLLSFIGQNFFKLSQIFSCCLNWNSPPCMPQTLNLLKHFIEWKLRWLCCIGFEFHFRKIAHWSELGFLIQVWTELFLLICTIGLKICTCVLLLNKFRWLSNQNNTLCFLNSLSIFFFLNS
jgi:hypothetical protein